MKSLLKKFKVSQVVNVIFFVILIYLVSTKIPTIWNNFSLENKVAPLTEVKRLSGETIAFPIPGKKMIVVFWATWCGPCKVELGRLNKMMALGEIKNDQLLAISIQESAETVLQFLKENPFQFLIGLDESGKLAANYNVSGTPTILFIDEQTKVAWATSGVSPRLESRVKEFLKN